MGVKSRSNYAIGINVSKEDWDKWFRKENNESTSGSEELETIDSKPLENKSS